jgi:hypothetical protein
VVIPRIRTLGLSGSSRLAIHAVRDWIVRSALAEVYVTETAAVFRGSTCHPALHAPHLWFQRRWYRSRSRIWWPVVASKAPGPTTKVRC